MRIVTNQFAAFVILLLSRVLPASTTWFLIVVFGVTGVANRDWWVDISFSRKTLLEFLISLRNGMPSGWPWGIVKKGDDADDVDEGVVVKEKKVA